MTPVDLTALALHRWTLAAATDIESGAIPFNRKAAVLHSFSVGAWLALLSFILWGTAIAWYLYGHHRLANDVATIMWRLGLRKTEPEKLHKPAKKKH